MSTILHAKSFKNFCCSTGAVESTKDGGETSSEGVSSRECHPAFSRYWRKSLLFNYINRQPYFDDFAFAASSRSTRDRYVACDVG